MVKDSKKQPKNSRGINLQTSQQTQAYIQQVNKQAKILLANNDAKLEKVNQKNQDKTYLGIFKKPQQLTPVKSTHALDNMQSNTYEFDNKTKKDHHYNAKNRIQTKQAYKFPLTSAQQYGWRPPIDTFTTNYGVKGTLDQFAIKPQQKTKK